MNTLEIIGNIIFAILCAALVFLWCIVTPDQFSPEADAARAEMTALEGE